MDNGTIKKLVSERGFGFIAAADGRELFFHQSGLVDVKMSSLTEGQAVSFDVEKAEKGPRAVNVRIAAKA